MAPAAHLNTDLEMISDVLDKTFPVEGDALDEDMRSLLRLLAEKD